MNCCDEYGNCRQGRDCPMRIARFKEPSILKRQLNRLAYWMLTAMIGMLWLALVLYYTYVYAN